MTEPCGRVVSESGDNPAASLLDSESLSQLFADLLAIQLALEAGGCCDHAEARAASVERGLELCGRAQAMAGLLGLFSLNEQLEDVSTEQLKYLLLPAIAGYLWSQRSGGGAQRPDNLRRCLGQLGDFLRLAGLYGVPGAPRVGEDEEAERRLAALVTCDDADDDDDGADGKKNGKAAGAASAQSDRTQKIERLRRRKELERQLTELRPLVEERPQVDEEDRRAFYLKLVERWVIVALEEAAAAKAELPLARMLAAGTVGAAAAAGALPASAARPPQAARKNFILTRSALEARVFGAGYPSLPTYSVEEWVDEQIRTGNFPTADTYPMGGPPPPGGPTPESRAAERAERDAKEDAEDPQELGRLRAWDEWRDHHRRGEGNRYRKG